MKIFIISFGIIWKVDDEIFNDQSKKQTRLEEDEDEEGIPEEYETDEISLKQQDLESDADEEAEEDDTFQEDEGDIMDENELDENDEREDGKSKSMCIFSLLHIIRLVYSHFET